MKEMTVREIVINWLKAHECDGLCGDECGCDLEDFRPCDDPPRDCVAAVKGPTPPEFEGYRDCWMTPKQFPDEPKGEPDEQ